VDFYQIEQVQQTKLIFLSLKESNSRYNHTFDVFSQYESNFFDTFDSKLEGKDDAASFADKNKLANLAQFAT
jgi:hypothetical protein